MNEKLRIVRTSKRFLIQYPNGDFWHDEWNIGWPPSFIRFETRFLSRARRKLARIYVTQRANRLYETKKS